MTDETFERVARTYGDMLYRVAYHALKNRADAEDVTQTVLLKLYQQGALAAAGGGEREPAPAALLLAEPRRAAG